MKFIRKLFHPDLAKIKADELLESELDLVKVQSHREYYQAMEGMLLDRIARLTEEIREDEAKLLPPVRPTAEIDKAELRQASHLRYRTHSG